MNLQYKIWDKPNKEWVKPPYCINQYGDLQVKDVVLFMNDDFEVVIYTGLNDCKRTKEYPNGQRIYEFDIVNVPYNNIGKVLVKFDRGIFNISRYDVSKCEVIGNKFDNPELLKGGVIK